MLEITKKGDCRGSPAGDAASMGQEKRASDLAKQKMAGAWNLKLKQKM